MKSQIPCLRWAILPLAVVIAVMWLLPMAMAQEPEAAAEEADQAQATAEEESRDAEQKRFREEIVVTAQRREERLVDVPLSISVFDGASIQDLTATDLVSLGPKMPNAGAS